jgi:Domain of unknown function (DUF4397)
MRKVILSVVLAPLLLSACYDDHNNGGYGYSGPSANFQFLQASPDAPSLSLLIDGQVWIDSIHYGDGTGEIQIPAGSHTVSVQASTPGGPVTVIAPATFDFQQNNDYVMAAEGPYASISSAVFPHVLSTVDSASTRIQFLQAAPNAPAMAVYLTAPGAALASSTPLGSGSIAFAGATDPSDVPAGSYEIRITPAGATTPVLFDSGSFTLFGGTDVVITALQNVGPGTASVVLGLVDSFDNELTLFDVSTPANVRVVNASADAPPLSVIANGNTASPLVPSLAFESFTPYISLTPNAYTFSVTPASNTAQVLSTQALTLNAGDEQTIYALGSFASLATQTTWDFRRRVATAAKLRIIQASPGASFVDVYLTAPGSGIASMPPTFALIPFGGDTGFQQFAAGSYDLTVTTAGTQTVLIGPTTVNIINTGVYTVAARDAPGGGSPYGLILMDDFAP